MSMWAFAWLVYSTPLLAAGYGGDSGSNRLGQFVLIAPDTSDEIVVYRSVKDFPAKRQSEFKFVEECDWLFDGQVQRLDCRKGTSSPLAGATYVRKHPRSKKYSNGCGGYISVMVCLTGCESKKVPRRLEEGLWEPC